jgi:superfamily II DNA or RNA helicase
MELNEQKSKIQNEALNAWLIANKRGTTEIITGLGKTFLSLKALYTMPLDKSVKHLFLAEQKDRLVDFIKDVKKFNTIYSCNVLQDYDIEFQCYQTVRNWTNKKFGLVIADEITDSMSPMNYKFYVNNQAEAILGLTAMFNGSIFYAVNEDSALSDIFASGIVSKEQMLNKFAPICYKYNINQGQNEGTSRKLNIFIVESYLNKVDKNITAGNAKHKFYQTEASAYKYADSLFNEVRDSEYVDESVDYYDWNEKREIELVRTASRRARLIYELPLKVAIVRRLLKDIKEKTVIFGNSIKQLELVTPNVVSSKNSDERNNSLRSMFDKDMIKTIGSFKKLVQGANLDKAGACIIMSYYSSETGFIQKIGRLRQDGDKDGNIFILHTLETQETVWLKKMMENAVDYNIFKGNVEECITEYNKLNN